MHIPDQMVANSVCTMASALTIGAGFMVVRQAIKSADRPKAETFAAVTALIFALQMLNFPISGGTSGHLLGGTLAAGWLGTIWGMISIAIVVAVQAVVFGDGGMTAMGANLLIMAVIGAGLGGLMREKLMALIPAPAATALASWASVMAAALGCSVLLGAGTSAGFFQVALPMLGVHALIGLGEAAVTTGILSAASKRVGLSFPVALSLIAVCASPLASGLPDGLEFVTGALNIHGGSAFFTAPMADYAVPGMAGMLSTVMAGMLGLATCFGLARLCTVKTGSEAI